MLDETNYPRMCSRWRRCSVNKCPLDPLNERRDSIAGDPERTCLEHLRERLAAIERARADGVAIPGQGYRPDEAKALLEGKPVEVLLTEWDVKVAARVAKAKHMRTAHGNERHYPPSQ